MYGVEPPASRSGVRGLRGEGVYGDGMYGLEPPASRSGDRDAAAAVAQGRLFSGDITSEMRIPARSASSKMEIDRSGSTLESSGLGSQLWRDF